VASKLILDWSPEQISGWLKIRYPKNESMRVSHETIYRSLFIQARGVLKTELIQHLRSKRLIRRSLHSRAGGQSRGQIVDAISIRERPAEIEDRAIPGHWEGDLLGGTSNSHIAPWWNDIRVLPCWSKCPSPYHAHGMKNQLPGGDGYDHGNDPGQDGDDQLLELLIDRERLPARAPL
jgi:hypothetical protein